MDDIQQLRHALNFIDKNGFGMTQGRDLALEQFGGFVIGELKIRVKEINAQIGFLLLQQGRFTDLTRSEQKKLFWGKRPSR